MSTVFWGIAILCGVSMLNQWEPTTEEKWAWSIVALVLFVSWAVQL